MLKWSNLHEYKTYTKILVDDPAVGTPAVAPGRLQAELENAVTWTRAFTNSGLANVTSRIFAMWGAYSTLVVWLRDSKAETAGLLS